MKEIETGLQSKKYTSRKAPATKIHTNRAIIMKTRKDVRLIMKKTIGEISKNHVVQAEVENFNYTLDWTSVKEEQDWEGASPTGVLLVALTGCKLVTAQSFLNRSEVDYEVIRAEVNGNFIKGKPNTKLEAEVTIYTDAKLEETDLPKMIDYLETYCTVASVLHEGNEIITKVELI